MLNLYTVRHNRRPCFLPLRSSETFIVCSISFAFFTDMFIYSLIVPILSKALIERAGALEQDVQHWVSVQLSAYGAALLLASPLFGYFADHCRTRKPPFIISLVPLGLSVCIFLVASTPAVFVLARALHGISSAAVGVVGLSWIVGTISDDRIGEALGYNTVAITWGSLLGQTLGGIVYENLGFYEVACIPIVIVLLDILFRSSIVEAVDQRDQEDQLDTASLHEQSPLLTREETAEAPTPRLQPPRIIRLMSLPRLPLCLLSAAAIASILAAFDATIPLFVMETFHWTSSGAGLIHLAISVPHFAASIIGKVADKLGGRILGTAAFSIAALALALLGFIKDDTITDQILLVVLLTILGLTLTTVDLVSMIEVSHAICSADLEPGTGGGENPMAQAYALYNVVMAGGLLCGPVVGGSMRVAVGWGGMTLGLGLMCAGCAVLFSFFGGQPVRKRDLERLDAGQ